MLVIQNDGFGRNPLDVSGGQFLHVHHERAVAVNVNDLLIRAGNLGAQCRGVAETHCAEAG